MFWLQHPPYLRWAAAVLLIAGAAAWEMRGDPVALHPFTTVPIEAGEPIAAGDLEWREVPEGLLPHPDLSLPVAAADLAAGTPLLDALLRDPVRAPDGWWEVPVALGRNASPGDEVLLVVVDPPATVAGLVVTSQRGDPYSLDYRPASVAVPADAAPLIAAASASGTLVAAARPASANAGGR